MLRKQFRRAQDLPDAAPDEGGSVRSLLADRPGSAIGLADASGAVAGSHGYDPHGQRTAATGRAAG